eukprot:scaffold24467_cov108-Skeletonema_dohrnii-CCMP3373.AAC.9
MVVVSSVLSSRRRHAMVVFAILLCTQLQLCLSQSHNDRHHRNTLIEESKYKLTTLPQFQIKLEIDLSTVITGGNAQKNLRRQLHLKSGRNRERRLSGNSGEGWVTNVDTTNDNNNNDEAVTSRPPKSNNGGGSWFSNTDNDDPNENQSNEILDPVGSNNNQENSGSWYADEISSSSSKPELAAVDSLSSLGTIKDALQQTTNGDKKTLSTYIRNLLVEYTTDFVTFFSYDALQSDERADRGWDVVHAIDLRGSLLDVTFYHEETHFIEDSDNQNQEESFASLTIGFSGTAAILKGANVDDILKGDTIGVKGTGGIQNRPIIGTNELRLMLRAAFARPDGPYEYLTYVLDESDRKEFILDKMTYEDSLEHDATILIGGSREVSVITDLDYLGGQASTLTFIGVGSEKAERRESMAAFFEGLFLVVFIGGFYVYASYKFRRNHLKQELMKYGEGAILVKSGEKTLFSPESKAKSRFKYMTRWLKYNRAPSPTSMETLEEDGYFGSESFDSDDYNDLEMGLKESYDESNRDKAGLDMGPIDVDSYSDYNFSTSGGFNTMKAIDDDMKENMQSYSRSHENVLKDMLENGVVPIPAKDDENAAYLMSNKGKSKRRKSLPDGGDSVIVQRRYVQPAAPLEVLYGAAFLHGEAERVEAQRRLRKKKKKIRASPSGRNRVKKKKKSTAKLVAQAMSGQRSKHAVNPMMTISESIDEVAEEDYDSDENEEDFIAPVSAYSPSNFMRNLSEWALGGKVGAENEEGDDDDDDEEEYVDEDDVKDDVEGDSEQNLEHEKGESEQDLEHEEDDEGESQSSTIAEVDDCPQVAVESGVGIDEEKEEEDSLTNETSQPSSNEDEGENDKDRAEVTAHGNDFQPSEEP